MGRVLMMRGRGGGVTRRHRRRHRRHRCRRAAQKNIKKKIFNKIFYMTTIFFDRILREYFTWKRKFSWQKI